MSDLHGIYHRMNSLDFRMGLAREKTARIATVIAHEQHAAAAMLPATKGRGHSHRTRRLAFWADEVRRHGWPDGLATHDG